MLKKSAASVQLTQSYNSGVKQMAKVRPRRHRLHRSQNKLELKDQDQMKQEKARKYRVFFKVLWSLQFDIFESAESARSRGIHISSMLGSKRRVVSSSLTAERSSKIFVCFRMFLALWKNCASHCTVHLYVADTLSSKSNLSLVTCLIPVFLWTSYLILCWGPKCWGCGYVANAHGSNLRRTWNDPSPSHGVAPSESSEHPDARRSSPPTFDNSFLWKKKKNLPHFVGAMVRPKNSAKSGRKKNHTRRLGKTRQRPH